MARGKNRKYSYQQYMSEAKVRPFELEVDETKTITIAVPDGDTLLEVSEKGDRPREVLRLLSGDQYDEVIELFGPAPAEVLIEFIGDLTTHFGMTAGSGDSRASSS